VHREAGTDGISKNPHASSIGFPKYSPPGKSWYHEIEGPLLLIEPRMSPSPQRGHTVGIDPAG
jgi:hypothetical protein